MDIERIQNLLQENRLTGWLLADFQGTNGIACRVAGIEGLITRRWFCFLPAKGEIVWIHSRVEPGLFSGRPGRLRAFTGYESMDQLLRETLPASGRVAMEYSPGGELPTASRVDAGTLERIRQLAPNLEIVSSARLLQAYLARWSELGLAAHRRAAGHLARLKDEALDRVARSLAAGTPITECSLQEFLSAQFQRLGLVTNHPPIVATDEHAGDPHFAPTPGQDRPIGADAVLLLDLWAKESGPEAIYADMTWMAWTGRQIPAEIQHAWEAVRDARDAALLLIQDRFRPGKRVEGWELDRAARDLIESRGYGEAFVHRTGHSLGLEDHGDGANLDDLESHDTRPMLPGTGFTIEPGVYLPSFGIRSEIDVFLGPDGPEVTTPIQAELDRLKPN